MTVDLLFTQHVAQGSLQASKGAISAGLPEEDPTAVSFLEFILARMAENAENDDARAENNSDPLQSENPALEKDPKLDIARLIADNPDIAEQVKEFSLDKNTELSNTLAMNQQLFDRILTAAKEHGLSIDKLDLPEGELPKIAGLFFIEESSTKHSATTDIKAILKKLEEMEATSPEQLITTNLTPQELSALKDALEALELQDEDAKEMVLNLGGLAYQVKIVPITVTEHVTVSDEAAIIALRPIDLQAAQAGAADGDTQQISGTLSALIMPLEDAEGSDFHQRFKEILQNVSGDGAKATKDADSDIVKTNNTSPAPAQNPGVKENFSTLQGWPFTLTGSLFSSGENGQPFMDIAGAQGHAPNITGLQNLTSLVTQAPGAGRAHPGTELIAAAIQKNVGAGKDTKIKLQLDPPELGRVDVKMTFGKDKSVKTMLTVEKPETFAMLQRDAHALERALQDAGLDVSDGALSFEMAQDDQGFSQDGSHDGSRHNMGRGEGNAELDENIIHSTMTWQVNPDTGHTHYNIIV